MTTEEKAKAYDEALSKARFYYGNCPLEPEKKKLEKLFPQLCESEDDRTKKELIQFLTDVKNISESGRTSWAVRKEDAEMCNGFIAYLEKQKEKSLPATEVLARAGLKPYKDGNQWCILAGDNIQEGICGFGDTIDEALYQFLVEVLEKQKELNHDGKKWIYQNDYYKVLRSWYMEGYQDREHNQEPKWIIRTGEGGPRYEENPKYGQPLTETQKPAEWSRESIIDALTKWLTEKIAPLHKKSLEGTITEREEMFEAALLEMRSLVNSPNFKIGKDTSAEWSEDDERILYNVIAYVGYAAGEKGVKDDDFKEANEWLNNLRNHHSWKPSEEQIEALKNAKIRMSLEGWGLCPLLQSLINELESL